ncbi:MAG: leucine-rich repeat protein, partial [Candidatus Methanomethylophilaceae archaeon]|nr:leucine-rich repeat protein [Candidatus Methanomethylophilaceae archaeon]
PIPMNVKIAEENQNFTIIDGVLYNADKTVLIQALNLTGDLTVPSTVETISSRAFNFTFSSSFVEAAWKYVGFESNPIEDCPELKITFPEGLVSFESSAMSGWPYEFNIPSTVENFGSSCFQDCLGLTEIYIGEDAAAGNMFINGCTNLKKITILNEEVDLNCAGAETVMLSDKVKTVKLSGNNVKTVYYQGIDPVEGSFLVPDDANVTAVPTGITGTIIIPSGTEALNSNMFFNTLAERIVLSEGLKTMASYSFFTCPNLKSLEIPASVESMGSMAIYSCPALESLVFLGETLPEMGDDVVIGCDKLLVLNEDGTKTFSFKYNPQNDGSYSTKVSLMGFSAPDNWDGTVTVPNDMFSFDAYYFMGTNVKKIVVDEGNEYYLVEDGILYSKDKKTLVLVSEEGKNVKIPSQVEVIGSYAFSPSIEGLTLDTSEADSLTTIDNYAFYSCGIKSFTAPATLTSIGQYAFRNIPSLETVDLSKVTAEKMTIGFNAFQGCSELYEVVFNDTSYYDIGSSAFNSTALKTFHVENGKISNDVLNSCTSLETAYFGTGVDYMWQFVTSNCPELETVYLLCSNLSSNVRSDAFYGFTGVIIIPLDDQDWSSMTDAFPYAYCVMVGNGNSFILPVVEGIGYDVVEKTETSVTMSFTLQTGYTDSEVSIKLGDTEIAEGENGYVATPTGKFMDLVISGVEPNRYNVSIEDSEIFDIVDLVYNDTYGSSYTFQVVPVDGYTFDGLKATVGEAVYNAYHGGKITVDITGDTVITVSGVVPETYDLVFVRSDGSTVEATAIYGVVFDIGHLGIGTTWYVKGSETPVDFSKTLTSDMVLYPEFTEADSVFVNVYYSHVAGDVTVTVDGETIVSGGLVPVDSTVSFDFDGGANYTLTGYRVNGVYYEADSDSFDIVASMATDVVLCMEFRHSGYSYIVDVPSVTTGDNLVKKIWFGQYNDPLQPSYDSNMPKGYVSVGDCFYITIEKRIYKVDLNQDLEEVPLDEMPHVELPSNGGQLVYAGGYIFELNNRMVFTPDLRQVASYGSSFTKIWEYEDCFIGTYNRWFIKFDLVENTAEPVEGQTWLPLVYSSLKEFLIPTDSPMYGIQVIDGQYMYTINATTSSADLPRKVSSIDLENMVIKETMSLDEWIYGHYLDDGWLTYYDGYLYLASYTSGLFGESNNLHDTTPKLIRVAVEDGDFIENSVQWIEMPNNTQQSGLVVFNGRGYIHSGADLIVIDIEKFEIIYKVTGQRTHGGIVVNTHYATPENGYKVYIYVLPYNATKSICVYEDCQGQTEGKTWNIENVGYEQYSTMNIRFTESGGMFWHNDSSIMFVYGKVKQDVSFTVDGKVVKTYQAVNGSVVELPDAPVRDGFVFAGWYGLNGDEITAETLVNGDIQAVAAFVPDVVTVSTAESDGMTVVTSDVFYLDHADIEDAYLLAIVEYEDKVIWTYQKIVWNGDTSSGRISVTTDGLKKVSVTLVDGDSPRDIESFGTDFVTF